MSTAAGAGVHVAIIMDGNGRWATRRGLPRTAGHLRGARAVRRVVEAARRRDVRTLTLYAFSGDNWQRPADEVSALMSIFRRHLMMDAARCAAQDIRLEVIGRRDRLPDALVHAVEAAEAATAHGASMRLRIAVDYSARDAIVAACAADGGPPHSREELADRLGRACHMGGPSPEVDLLLRTGGERRLSDFMLWESAYAELLFVDRLWPDFSARDLDDALAELARRDRRFGRIAESATG